MTSRFYRRARRLVRRTFDAGERYGPGYHADVLAWPGGKPRVYVMNRWLGLSFVLPAFIMLFALACNQIWPFGTKSVLTIDLYHMYSVLIAHLHDIIYEGSAGAWSWSIGGGINYFTLYLTNVGSPLNAVIALFPKTWLPDLVAVGMVVKVGLSGLCMGWLLRYKWRFCDGWITVFAAMYALCGWAVNYYWNIMWADLLFLLPLCLLGIELMIERGCFGTYVAALTAAMLCNYYIAVLMCVFLLLYFIIAVLSRFSMLREKRWIIKRALLFGGLSLLCAGIAALCLMPVYKALMATSVVSDAMPKWALYHNFIDVLKGVLPGAKANIRSGGLPHIYAGWLTIWLLPLWLSDKRASLKWRILGFLGLAGMIAVMNIKPLDFLWHGMHIPNDLPFRYSFCISALMIVLACPAARRINRRTLPVLYLWGAAILVFLGITEGLADAQNIPRLVAVPVLVLALSLLFWLCFVRGRVAVPTMRLIALGLVCAELAFGATWGVWGTGTTGRGDFVRNIEQYSAMARIVDELGQGDFFRTETATYMTLNDPALYGFYGLSHFSSMLGADLQDLMHKLGYQTFMHGTIRANRQAGQPNTPVVDSMLGVRYLLAKRADKLDEQSTGLLRRVYTDGTIDILENTYALPLVFQVQEAVLNDWALGRDGPFNVQSSFVELATGERRVLRPVRERTWVGEDLSLTRSSDNNYRYNESKLDSPGTVVLTFSVSTPSHLYFYADGDQMTNVEAVVRPYTPDSALELEPAPEALRTVSFDGRYPKVLPLGLVEPGQEVVVRITAGRTRTDGTLKAWMASLDMATFQRAFATLQAGGLQQVEHGNDFIRGTITAPDGMALMTSIPADEGWTLRIDGRETDIVPIGEGALIGALLPAGTHEIDLQWTLPGFDLGFKISLTSIMLLVLFWAITTLEPLKVPPERPYLPWAQRFEPPVPPPEEPGDALPGEDLSAYLLPALDPEPEEEEQDHA